MSPNNPRSPATIGGGCALCNHLRKSRLLEPGSGCAGTVPSKLAFRESSRRVRWWPRRSWRDAVIRCEICIRCPPCNVDGLGDLLFVRLPVVAATHDLNLA